MVEVFALRYRQLPTERQFLENIFGFDGEGFQSRDYFPLLKNPARVYLAGVPLMPKRPRDMLMPSLVGEPERERLRALNPMIKTTTITNAGHAMIWHEDLMIKRLNIHLDAAIKAWALSAPQWAPEP